MFTEFSFLGCLGYIGDVAFVIGGVLTAKNLKLHWFVQWLSGMSTAFFGGILLRDTLLLQMPPAIFCKPIEIMATGIIGILTVISLRKKMPGKAFDWLLCIIDSIGIAGSAAAGYGRGIKAGVIIALFCGLVTAIGGGVIAAAIRAIAQKKIRVFVQTLVQNRSYYLFGASMSIAYGILDSVGQSNDTTLLMLTAVAIIIGIFVMGNKKTPVCGQRRP